MTELSYRENFLVDTTLSLAAVALVAPLRTVNLKMQLTKGVYNNPWHCAKELGFSSLWKGNLWRCVRFFPSRIIDITTEERIPSLLSNIPGVWQSILSSILGSTLSLALVYPIDVHMIRLINKMDPNEVDEEKIPDESDDEKELVFDLSDYAGFRGSVARMVVYFLSYYLLNSIMEYSLPSRIPKMEGMLLRFYLQLGADWLSYPLDTISRVQVTKKISFMEAYKDVKEDGLYEGFYHSYKWNFCISFLGMLIGLSAGEIKRMYTNFRCK